MNHRRRGLRGTAPAASRHPRLLLLSLSLALSAPAPSQAPPAPPPPSTYGGLTPAQWLRAEVPYDRAAIPAEFTAVLTRAHAMAAFGIVGEPLETLKQALAGPADGPLVALAAAVAPSLPEAAQFAEPLRERLRRCPGQAHVLAALLAIDASSWPAVSAPIRTELANTLTTRGPAEALRHPLWHVLPVPAVSADPAWLELLGKVLDQVPALPPPRELAPVFGHSPRLAAAIARTQRGALPDLEWLDVLHVGAPELPRQQELEAALRENLVALKKATEAWAPYPDTDAPEPDHACVRRLGLLGAAGMPLLEALIADPDVHTSSAGREALGQLARYVPKARARLVELLDAEAVRATQREFVFVQRPLFPLAGFWPMQREFPLPGVLAAIRGAGAPMLPLLLQRLQAAQSPVVKVLVLDALGALWATPGSLADSGGARAPLQFEPVLPLLDDPDPAVREAAITIAAALATHFPIPPGELAGLEARLREAEAPTPRLRVEMWRAWAYDGAWLARVATTCREPVAAVLRYVATTSPGAQPAAAPLDVPPFGFGYREWYQRARACQRVATQPEKAGYASQLAYLQEHDPDLLVRSIAARAAATPTK